MLDLLKFDITANDRTAAAFGRIKGELGGVRGALVGVDDYAKRAGRSMRNIGAGLTAGVTTPLALLGKQSVQLYDTQVQAEKSVAQAILSTGGAAGKTAEQLKALASEMQGATTFGDEDILRNVTAPLLTFTKIQGEVFDKAQANVLDMATLLKMDLKSAAILVGKALNDPIKGISALSRSGVQFSEDQKKVIKALVETGDVAAAQAVILRELDTQFQGQAAAAANAPLGRWAQLSNAIGDVKEQLGEQVVPFLKPLVETVKEGVTWFGTLTPEVRKNIVVFGGLAAATGPLLVGLGLVVLSVSALVSPLNLIAALLGGGAAAWYLWGAGANSAGESGYDAAKGTAALNTALGVFSTTAAPSAARSAIDLANDNYKLAESSFFAAKAEIAKRRAALQAAEALKSGQMDPRSRKNRRDAARREYDDAMADLNAADAALQEAQAGRLRAARTVTGSSFVKALNEQFDAEPVVGAIRDVTSEIVNASGASKRLAENLNSLKGAPKTALEITEDRLSRIKSASEQVNQSFGRTASSILRNAESARDAVSGLLDALADQLLTNAASSIFSKLGVGSLFGPLLANAKGNVFSGGAVTAFASGGIVSGPTTFPMRGGLGLMGEAGPEAIMPLARGSDGKLGVRAQGGVGATNVVHLNFAPVIDARGADQAAVARIEAGQREMYDNFGQMVHETLRASSNRRTNPYVKGR